MLRRWGWQTKGNSGISTCETMDKVDVELGHTGVVFLMGQIKQLSSTN